MLLSVKVRKLVICDAIVRDSRLGWAYTRPAMAGKAMT
jgi:hypothetical protein